MWLTSVQVVQFDLVKVELPIEVVVYFTEDSVDDPHVWFLLNAVVEFGFLDVELSCGKALKLSSLTRLVQIRVLNLSSAVSQGLLPVDIWQGNLKGPWPDVGSVFLLDPVYVCVALGQFYRLIIVVSFCFWFTIRISLHQIEATPRSHRLFESAMVPISEPISATLESQLLLLVQSRMKHSEMEVVLLPGVRELDTFNNFHVLWKQNIKHFDLR